MPRVQPNFVDSVQDTTIAQKICFSPCVCAENIPFKYEERRYAAYIACDAMMSSWASEYLLHL